MVRSLGFALFLLAAGALLATQTDEKSDRILKTFVEEFVELTPGKGKFPASFEMGTSAPGALDTEKPPVMVRFATPFAMAKYEVTQELYQRVMGTAPSKWKGPRNSVERIDWNEAKSFCKKATVLLRERKLLDAKDEIRLPSEAEWEYACRAGTTTSYGFGDDARDLREYAWFIGNSKGEDPPVGKKKPNAWGLYDMHGYIWEWCEDTWQPSHKGADPTGLPRKAKDEKRRVVRGGSWADPADAARSAFRAGELLTERNDRIGFRCVRARER